MDIILRFADTVSDAYRENLQTFSDAILAQGLTENRPPSIWFTGMNRETFDKINYLQHAYDKRY